MLVKSKVMTIKGDSLRAMITNKGLLLEIEHNCNHEELYNSEMVALLEKDKIPLNFNAYSNLNVNAS